MKIFKFFLVISTLIIFVGFLLFNNIILIRYLKGNARNLGKHTNAKVYANGKLNKDIEIYKVTKYWNGKNAEYYLVNFTYLKRKLVSVNYDYNYVGIPSSTNENDYKKIFGNLLQTEVGGKFTPIDNQIKGLGFDPQLKYNKTQIKFLLPKSEYGIDSLRIEL